MRGASVKMTCVTIIDKRHHELVNMLNKLNDAVKNDESREDIYRVIDDVIAVTRLHFATEEQLMIQSGYTKVKWHKDKHKELIKDTLYLKWKLVYVGEELFTEWFNHWPFARVLAHIQHADKQLEDYIVQRGINAS
jgi:hemerythrin-like metal-binding protein